MEGAGIYFSFSNFLLRLLRRTVFITLFLLNFLIPFSVFSSTTQPSPLPVLDHVQEGALEITLPDSKTMAMHQTTQDVVADFQSFNIAQDHRVDLTQPNRDANAFFRVNKESGLSTIDGTFTATGNVFLLNPNGILIGKNGVIDMNAFIASTHDDFMRGIGADGKPFIQLHGLSNPNAEIRNEGRITVADSGVAAFASPITRNDGGIFGRAAFVAGQRTTMTLDGSDIVRFQVDGKVERALVEQKGTVKAQGKEVILSTADAEHFMDTNMINMDGETVGAKITVSGGEGSQVVVGPRAKLDATGEHGGHITVVGDSVHAQSGATLDASGDLSGGKIWLGGGPEGHGTDRNAKTLQVDDDVVMRADSRVSGNAGEIINYADITASLSGLPSAQALGKTGDGGFIEYSGKQHLWFAQDEKHLALVGSKGGNAGMFFIDPATINIINSGSTSSLTATTVAPSYILAQLGTGNVTMTADTSITVTDSIDDSSAVRNRQLSLTAPTITLSSGKAIKLGNGTNSAQLMLTTNNLSSTDETGIIQVAGGVTVNAFSNNLTIFDVIMKSDLLVNNALEFNTTIANIYPYLVPTYDPEPSNPQTRIANIYIGEHRRQLSVNWVKFQNSDSNYSTVPSARYTGTVEALPIGSDTLVVSPASGAVILGIAARGTDVNIRATTIDIQGQIGRTSDLPAPSIPGISYTPSSVGSITFNANTVINNANIFHYSAGDINIYAQNFSGGYALIGRNITIDRSQYTIDTTKPGIIDLTNIYTPGRTSITIKGVQKDSGSTVLLPNAGLHHTRSLTLDTLTVANDLTLTAYVAGNIPLGTVNFNNVQLLQDVIIDRSTVNNTTDVFNLTFTSSNYDLDVNPSSAGFAVSTWGAPYSAQVNNAAIKPLALTLTGPSVNVTGYLGTSGSRLSSLTVNATGGSDGSLSIIGNVYAQSLTLNAGESRKLLTVGGNIDVTGAVTINAYQAPIVIDSTSLGSGTKTITGALGITIKNIATLSNATLNSATTITPNDNFTLSNTVANSSLTISNPGYSTTLTNVTANNGLTVNASDALGSVTIAGGSFTGVNTVYGTTINIGASPTYYLLPILSANNTFNTFYGPVAVVMGGGAYSLAGTFNGLLSITTNNLGLNLQDITANYGLSVVGGTSTITIQNNASFSGINYISGSSISINSNYYGQISWGPLTYLSVGNIHYNPYIPQTTNGSVTGGFTISNDLRVTPASNLTLQSFTLLQPLIINSSNYVIWLTDIVDNYGLSVTSTYNVPGVDSVRFAGGSFTGINYINAPRIYRQEGITGYLATFGPLTSNIGTVSGSIAPTTNGTVSGAFAVGSDFVITGTTDLTLSGITLNQPLSISNNTHNTTLTNVTSNGLTVNSGVPTGNVTFAGGSFGNSTVYGSSILFNNSVTFGTLGLITNTLDGVSAASITAARDISLNNLSSALTVSDLTFNNNISLNNTTSANTTLSNLSGSFLVKILTHNGTLTVDGNTVLSSGQTTKFVTGGTLSPASIYKTTNDVANDITLTTATTAVIGGLLGSGIDVNVKGRTVTVSGQIGTTSLPLIGNPGDLTLYGTTVNVNNNIYQYRLGGVGITGRDVGNTSGSVKVLTGNNVVVSRDVYLEDTTTAGSINLSQIDITGNYSLGIVGMNPVSAGGPLTTYTPYSSTPTTQQLSLLNLKLAGNLSVVGYNSNIIALRSVALNAIDTNGYSLTVNHHATNNTSCSLFVSSSPITSNTGSVSISGLSTAQTVLLGDINAQNLTLSYVTGNTSSGLNINTQTGYSTGITTFTTGLNFFGKSLTLGGQEVRSPYASSITISTTGQTIISATLKEYDRGYPSNFIFNGVFYGGSELLLSPSTIDKELTGTLSIYNAKVAATSNPDTTTIPLQVNGNVTLTNVIANSPLLLTRTLNSNPTISIIGSIFNKTLTVDSTAGFSTITFSGTTSFNGAGFIVDNSSNGVALAINGPITFTGSSGEFIVPGYYSQLSATVPINLSGAKRVIIPRFSGGQPSLPSFIFESILSDSYFGLSGYGAVRVVGGLRIQAATIDTAKRWLTRTTYEGVYGDLFSAQSMSIKGGIAGNNTFTVTGGAETVGLEFAANTTQGGITLTSDSGAPIFVGPSSDAISIAGNLLSIINPLGETTFRNVTFDIPIEVNRYSNTGTLSVGANVTWPTTKSVTIGGATLSASPSASGPAFVVAGQAIPANTSLVRINGSTVTISPSITGNYDLLLEGTYALVLGNYDISISTGNITLSPNTTASPATTGRLFLRSPSITVYKALTAPEVFISGDDEVSTDNRGNGTNMYFSALGSINATTRTMINANGFGGDHIFIDSPSIGFQKPPNFQNYSIAALNTSTPTGATVFVSNPGAHITGLSNNTITLGGYVKDWNSNADLSTFILDPGSGSVITLLDTFKKSGGAALTANVILKSGGFSNTNLTTTGNITIGSASGTISNSNFTGSKIYFDASQSSTSSGDLFVEGTSTFNSGTSPIPITVYDTNKRLTFRNMTLTSASTAFNAQTSPVYMHNVTIQDIPAATVLSQIIVANGTGAGTVTIQDFVAFQAKTTASIVSGVTPGTLNLNFPTGSTVFNLQRINGASPTSRFGRINVDVPAGVGAGTVLTLLNPPSVASTGAIYMIPGNTLLGTLSITGFNNSTDLLLNYQGSRIVFGNWSLNSLYLNPDVTATTRFKVDDTQTLSTVQALSLGNGGTRLGSGVILEMGAKAALSSPVSINLGPVQFLGGAASAITFNTGAFTWAQGGTIIPGDVGSIAITATGNATVSSTSTISTDAFTIKAGAALDVNAPIQTHTAGNTGTFLFQTTAGTGPFKVRGTLGGDGTSTANQPKSITFSPFAYNVSDVIGATVRSTNAVSLLYTGTQTGTSMEFTNPWAAPNITVDTSNTAVTFNALGTSGTPIEVFTAKSAADIKFNGEVYAKTMNVVGGSNAKTVTFSAPVHTNALNINYINGVATYYTGVASYPQLLLQAAIDAITSAGSSINIFGSATTITGNIGGTTPFQSFGATASGTLTITDADIKLTTGTLALTSTAGGIQTTSTSGNNMLSTTGSITFSATADSTIKHILDIGSLNLSNVAFNLTFLGSRIGKTNPADRGALTLTGATNNISLDANQILFATTNLSGSRNITIQGTGTNPQFVSDTININTTKTTNDNVPQEFKFVTPITTKTLNINIAPGIYKNLTTISFRGPINYTDNTAKIIANGGYVSVAGALGTDAHPLESFASTSVGSIDMIAGGSIKTGILNLAAGTNLGLSGDSINVSGNLTLSAAGTFTANMPFTRTGVGDFTVSNTGNITLGNLFQYSGGGGVANGSLSLTSTAGNVLVNTTNPLTFTTVTLSATAGTATFSSSTSPGGFTSFTANASSILMNGSTFQTTGTTTLTSSGAGGITVPNTATWTVAGLTMTANGTGNVSFSPASLTATGATSITSNGSTGISVSGGTWNVAALTMLANGSGNVAFSPTTLTATGATSITSNGSTGVTISGGTWNVGTTLATITAQNAGGINISGSVNLLGSYTFQVANGLISVAGGIGSSTTTGGVTTTKRSGTLTFNRTGSGSLSFVGGTIYADTLSINLPVVFGDTTPGGATTFDTTNAVAIDLTGLGASGNITVNGPLTVTKSLTLAATNLAINSDIFAPITSTVDIKGTTTSTLAGSIGSSIDDDSVLQPVATINLRSSFSLTGNAGLASNTITRSNNSYKIYGKATATPTYPTFIFNIFNQQFTGDGNTLGDWLSGHFQDFTFASQSLTFNNIGGANFTIHGTLSLDVADPNHIEISGVSTIGSMSFPGSIAFLDPVDITAPTGQTAAISINNAITFAGLVTVSAPTTITSRNNIIFSAGVSATNDLAITAGARTDGRSITINGAFGGAASPINGILSLTAATINLDKDVYAKSDIKFDANRVVLGGGTNGTTHTVSSAEGVINVLNDAMHFDNDVGKDLTMKIVSTQPFNLQHFRNGTLKRIEAVNGFLMDSDVDATGRVDTLGAHVPLDLVGGDVIVADTSTYLSNARLTIHGSLLAKATRDDVDVTFNTQAGSLIITGGVAQHEDATHLLRDIILKSQDHVELQGEVKAYRNIDFHTPHVYLRGATTLFAETGFIYRGGVATGGINPIPHINSLDNATPHSLTIDVPSAITVGHFGHLHPLRNLTIIARAGNITLDGAYTLAVNENRTYTATTGTVVGLSTAHLSGAWVTTLNTLGAVTLPAVGTGGAGAIGGLNVSGVQGGLTLTGHILSKDIVSLPANTTFGANRRIESLGQDMDGKILEAANQQGIIIRSANPNATGTFTLIGKTTFPNATTLSTADTFYLKGNIIGQSTLSISKPVRLLGDLSIRTTGSLTMTSSAQSDGATKYNLSLTSLATGSAVDSFTNLAKLSIVFPGDITYSAKWVADALHIESTTMDRIIVGSNITTQNGLWLKGHTELRHAGNAIFINNTTGPIYFGGKVYWQAGGAHDLTITQNNPLEHITLNLERAANPSTNITINGPAHLSGVFNTPGALTISGSTLLTGATEFDADAITAGSIDGYHTLKIIERNGFTQNGSIGSTTRLKMLAWDIDNTTTDIRQNVNAETVQFWVPDTNFNWAGKVTADRLILIPETGGKGFAIQAPTGQAMTAFNFRGDALANSSRFNIKRLDIGDINKKESIYLQGILPLRNIPTYIYGYVVTYGDGFLVTADGRLIDFIGSLTQSPEQRNLMSLIDKSVEEANTSPIEGIMAQLSRPQGSALITIPAEDVGVQIENIRIRDNGKISSSSSEEEEEEKDE